MLPESKDEFPKLLYLDQCKWIDLSKAHYGRPGGEPFHDALAAVRKAVKAGTLILPFSAVNTVELEADPYPDRRERLARFMVELSANHSILPFMTVRPWEVRNAVYALLKRPELICVRRSIIGKGIDHSLGGRLRVAGVSPEVEAEILEYTHSVEESVETSVEFILACGDNRELTTQMRAAEVANLDLQERVRKRSAQELTWEQRYGAELADHVSQGDVGNSLAMALSEVGVHLTAFFDRFQTPAAYMRFFAGIPTFHIAVTLTMARDQDLVRSIHQNDARDLIWLAVALTYSNLIVSEKYWASMVWTQGLDAMYGTRVITDVSELPARLTEMGCL